MEGQNRPQPFTLHPETHGSMAQAQPQGLPERAEFGGLKPKTVIPNSE